MTLRWFQIGFAAEVYVSRCVVIWFGRVLFLSVLVSIPTGLKAPDLQKQVGSLIHRKYGRGAGGQS